jgi:hypothetical protein
MRVVAMILVVGVALFGLLMPVLVDKRHWWPRRSARKNTVRKQ